MVGWDGVNFNALSFENILWQETTLYIWDEPMKVWPHNARGWWKWWLSERWPMKRVDDEGWMECNSHREREHESWWHKHNWSGHPIIDRKYTYIIQTVSLNYISAILQWAIFMLLLSLELKNFTYWSVQMGKQFLN